MSLLQQIFRPLLGIFFGIMLLLSSLIGDSVIMIILPLLFLNRHQQWRICIDHAVSFWIIVPVTFLEYIFGVQFKVTGDTIDYDRPAAVIMNHRTRLDWMFFWAALFKINPWLLISSKIILKAELRRLPGAGFGMEANHFIFLDRKLKTDKERISEAIQYYASVGRNYQILLFPEGTDKTAGTTIRSNMYAKKNGLKELNNLIYPRTAGFIHLINEMKRYNYIECIYDVTIAYPANVVQSEISLMLTGRTPQKVLFHIERIDVSRLPLKDHEIAQWINEGKILKINLKKKMILAQNIAIFGLWIEKDKKLDLFYSQQSSRKHFPNDENKFIWEEDNSLQKIVKLFTLCFWLLLTIIWLYHMTFLRLLQVISAYCFFAYVYIHGRYGGIQRMVYVKWSHAMGAKIAHW